MTPHRHHANVAAPDKKLKVGIVSGDLGATVCSFSVQLLTRAGSGEARTFRLFSRNA